MIDDSIVRGHTCKKLVKTFFKAGAKEVHLLISSPPIRYPDFYGIDIPTREELIAARMSEEEIRKFIGADLLIFQTVDDLSEAIMRRGEHKIDRLSMPYFDGWYVTGDVNEASMNAVKEARTKERGYTEEV